MPRSIFFCRHGRADGSLTQKGVAEVKELKDRLEEIGFHPTCAFSSDMERAIQTVALLCPKGIYEVTFRLRALGSLTSVDVAVDADSEEMRPVSAAVYAKETYDYLLSHFPKGGRVIVVSHDYTSILLAREHLRRLHSITFPGTGDLSFPAPGEGILVEGTSFTIFKH
jgi:hypothetical protein